MLSFGSGSHLQISHMNIWCCCLHKLNKLLEIKNEPRELLTNVIKVNKYFNSEFRVKKV